VKWRWKLQIENRQWERKWPTGIQWCQEFSVRLTTFSGWPSVLPSSHYYHRKNNWSALHNEQTLRPGRTGI
jgi:hypothetical protein